MLHGNSSSSSNLDNTHRFLRESPLFFLRLKTVGLNTVAGSVQSLWVRAVGAYGLVKPPLGPIVTQGPSSRRFFRPAG
jgi:hypothetical protein